jgi:ferredoxin-NADP reductase
MSQHLLGGDKPKPKSMRVAMSGSSIHEVMKCLSDPDYCWNSLGLISGGSGLTLMLSIIEYHVYFARKRKQEGREVTMSIQLVNCVHSPEDQFGNEMLVRLVNENEGILGVTQVTSVGGDSGEELAEFQHYRGRVSAKSLMGMPTKGDDAGVVVICGPHGFTDAVDGLLQNELMLPKEMIRKF